MNRVGSKMGAASITQAKELHLVHFMPPDFR
jgi:hypothetical protein